MKWHDLPVQVRKKRLLAAIEWVKGSLKEGRHHYICYALDEYRSHDVEASRQLASMVRKAIYPYISLDGWAHRNGVYFTDEKVIPYRLEWLDKVAKAIKEFKK